MSLSFLSGIQLGEEILRVVVLTHVDPRLAPMEAADMQVTCLTLDPLGWGPPERFDETSSFPDVLKLENHCPRTL